MLDKCRAAGRPVTPAMEKMAKWMDDMDGGLVAGDLPMLKPGKRVLDCRKGGCCFQTQSSFLRP